MNIDTTNDGYLRNLDDWTPEVAEELARRQNISLSADHWEIINLVRDFYSKYQASPAIRTLINALKQQYGEEKGNSIYLHRLFPGAAKQVSNIAGLPKPIRCM